MIETSRLALVKSRGRMSVMPDPLWTNAKYMNDYY